jgi:hypothetical protein
MAHRATFRAYAPPRFMTRLLENVIVVVCDASFFVVGGRTLFERYGKYVLIRKSELDRAERDALGEILRH